MTKSRPLLKIDQDENGFLTISRPPFKTVFNPDEVGELRQFFVRNASDSGSKKVLDNLIAWIKDTRDMSTDNINNGYGSLGDYNVATILTQILEKYTELNLP